MSTSIPTVSDYADVFNGKTPATADKRNEGYPVLKIKDVDEYGQFRGSFQSFVDQEFAEKHSSKKIKEGDVLILNAAHNAEYVGSKQFVAGAEVVGAIATGEWLIVRAKRKKTDADYLAHWLSSAGTRFAMGSLVKGIHLYPRDVARMRFSPPNPSDQKRIAAILGKVDEIRRKRQQAIRLADEFLRSVFLDMFGDPFLNKKGWPYCQVDSFCRLVRGSSPRPKGDPRFYGGQVPRLMVEDLTRDGWIVTPKVDSLTVEGASKSRPVPAGTVVMVVSGKVGVMSTLAVDACIHDGFVGFLDLDKERVLPGYLMFVMTFLQHTHAQREAGAIFKNLTTTQVKEMKIPLPVIEAQKEFSGIFRRQRLLIEKMGSGLEDDLFGSLAQRAFSGEL